MLLTCDRHEGCVVVMDYPSAGECPLCKLERQLENEPSGVADLIAQRNALANELDELYEERGKKVMKRLIIQDFSIFVQERRTVYAVIVHTLSDRIDLKKGRILGSNGRDVKFLCDDGDEWDLHSSRVFYEVLGGSEERWNTL